MLEKMFPFFKKINEWIRGCLRVLKSARNIELIAHAMQHLESWRMSAAARVPASRNEGDNHLPPPSTLQQQTKACLSSNI